MFNDNSFREAALLQATFKISNGLVLITGGTGHVEFRNLVTALKAGYHVRAAIRSEYKKD